MVDTVLILEGNCRSISEEVGMPKQVGPLILALHLSSLSLEPKAASAPVELSGQQWSASNVGDLHFWPREEMVPVWCLHRRAWSSSPVLECGQGAGRRWGHSQQSLEKPFYDCFDLSSAQVIRIRA